MILSSAPYPSDGVVNSRMPATHTVWIVGLLLVIGILGCSSSVVSADLPSSKSSTVHPRAKEIQIPTRDRKFLAADLILPSKPGPHPVILMMTPYNRKTLGSLLADPNYKNGLFDHENYAYVLVDRRGFFGSKKARSRPLQLLMQGRDFLTQIGDDGYDTVEWIAQQSWSNGKVGMWGPSALGRVQYEVAATRPPHLVCIVPVVSEYHYSYELYYWGGVRKNLYANLLGGAGYGVQRKSAKHQRLDAFWKKLGKYYKPEKINVPVLMVAGWYDLYTEGMLINFNDIMKKGGPKAKQHSRIIIGPWSHTLVGMKRQGELDFPAAQAADVQPIRQFYDYWLRGIGKDLSDTQQRFNYYQMGKNRWQQAASFPPPNAKTSEFYLHSGGKLLPQASTVEKKLSTFTYDPADPSPTIGGTNAFLPTDPQKKTIGSGPRDQRNKVMGRNDLLVFKSDKLLKDIDMVGTTKLKLFISSDAADTDFAVRLCDIHPDGRVMLVTDGIQRARLRNSLSTEELMQPGNIYPIAVRLSVTAHTFRKGHQIALLITSSNYPKFDLNKNLAKPDKGGARAIVAHNQVHHNRSHPSVLSITTVN